MRDDMVTHLAERCPRQVRAQAQIEGALDCEKKSVSSPSPTQPTVSSTCMNPAPQRFCKTTVSDEPIAKSEEHTSELQSLMRNSYAVFCLKKKKTTRHTN